MVPVKLQIITFGRIGREYSNLIEEYEKRIKNLAHVKFLRNSKIPSDAILLDQRGKELDGEQFYELLRKRSQEGKEIVFAVGPPEGFEKIEGYECISLSKLTFRHELAYLILLEQIYRALLRMKGTNYEK